MTILRKMQPLKSGCSNLAQPGASLRRGCTTLRRLSQPCVDCQQLECCNLKVAMQPVSHRLGTPQSCARCKAWHRKYKCIMGSQLRLIFSNFVSNKWGCAGLVWWENMFMFCCFELTFLYYFFSSIFFNQ